MLSLKLLTLALSLASLAPHAYGGLIYDNGLPTGSGGHNLTVNRLADDFTLAAPTTLTGVRFWMAIFNGGNFSGDLSWAIYNNNAGAIGTLVGSGSTSSATLTPSGTSACALGCSTFQVDFAINQAIGAGSFWLELHEGLSLGGTDPTSVYWADRSSVTGNPAKADGNLVNPPAASLGDVDYAFQLFNSATQPGPDVPEPSTYALMASGLALAALARRFRR